MTCCTQQRRVLVHPDARVASLNLATRGLVRVSATRGLCAVVRLREVCGRSVGYERSVRVSLRVRPAVAFDCLFNGPFLPSVTNGEFFVFT